MGRNSHGATGRRITLRSADVGVGEDTYLGGENSRQAVRYPVKGVLPKPPAVIFGGTSFRSPIYFLQKKVVFLKFWKSSWGFLKLVPPEFDSGTTPARSAPSRLFSKEKIALATSGVLNNRHDQKDSGGFELAPAPSRMGFPIHHRRGMPTRLLLGVPKGIWLRLRPEKALARSDRS